MDTKFQTSFIPKKPMAMGGLSNSGGMSLLLLVSIIIFLVSLGIAGYVFLEKNLLIQKITADLNTIKQNESGLVSDSITIEDLVQLNSRINVAKGLLSKHVTLSPIFDFLQLTTLKNVRFKNFTFSSVGKDTSGTAKISLQLSGQAKDWETVASQADEFGQANLKKIISEPKISSLTLNVDGSISFVFSAFVTPDYLLYGNIIKNN